MMGQRHLAAGPGQRPVLHIVGYRHSPKAKRPPRAVNSPVSRVASKISTPRLALLMIDPMTRISHRLSPLGTIPSAVIKSTVRCRVSSVLGTTMVRVDVVGALTYMVERLEDCHQRVKPTGSIHLRYDPTASHLPQDSDGRGVLDPR